MTERPRRRHARRALWLLLALTLALPLACAGDDEEPSLPDHACLQAWIPSQLGFAWERLNHRVSYLEVRRDEGCAADTGRVGFIGGDFTTGETLDDDAIVRYQAHRVVGAGPEAPRFARQSVEVMVQAPSWTLTERVPIDRAALGFRRRGHVAAIVEGFAIDTRMERPPGYPLDYNPAHGYTTRGHTLSVDVRDAQGPAPSLDVTLRFEPGLAHDRLPHNQALAHARIRVRVDLLLVDAGASAPVEASVAYDVAYSKPVPLQDSVLEPVDEGLRLVEVDGRPGLPAGFYGWRRIHFVWDPDPTCRRTSQCSAGAACEEGLCVSDFPAGYYMRDMSVDVVQRSYDPTTGRALFDLHGYASNTTAFLEFHGLRSRFEGAVLWWQAPGRQGETAWELRFPAGEREVGWEDGGVLEREASGQVGAP